MNDIPAFGRNSIDSIALLYKNLTDKGKFALIFNVTNNFNKTRYIM